MIKVNVLNSETELYDNHSNPLVTKNSKNSNNEAKKGPGLNPSRRQEKNCLILVG